MKLHIKMVYASRPIIVELDAIKIENGMFSMYRNNKRLFTYDLHSIDYFYYEKEIVIKLPDETVKRYQRNEWTIVHTSIHYF